MEDDMNTLLAPGLAAPLLLSRRGLQLLLDVDDLGRVTHLTEYALDTRVLHNPDMLGELLPALRLLRLDQGALITRTATRGPAADYDALSVEGGPLPHGRGRPRVPRTSYIPSWRLMGAHFKQLRILYLSRCSLQDLGGIGLCPLLEEIYIAYNNIHCLEPLIACAALQVIDAEGNCIDIDASPAGGQTGRIVAHDLFGLPWLRQLTTLNLYGNPCTRHITERAQLLDGTDGNTPDNDGSGDAWAPVTLDSALSTFGNDVYRLVVIRRLPHLTVLDDAPITDAERAAARGVAEGPEKSPTQEASGYETLLVMEDDSPDQDSDSGSESHGGKVPFDDGGEGSAPSRGRPLTSGAGGPAGGTTNISARPATAGGTPVESFSELNLLLSSLRARHFDPMAAMLHRDKAGQGRDGSSNGREFDTAPEVFSINPGNDNASSLTRSAALFTGSLSRSLRAASRSQHGGSRLPKANSGSLNQSQSLPCCDSTNLPSSALRPRPRVVRSTVGAALTRVDPPSDAPTLASYAMINATAKPALGVRSLRNSQNSLARGAAGSAAEPFPLLPEANKENKHHRCDSSRDAEDEIIDETVDECTADSDGKSALLKTPSPPRAQHPTKTDRLAGIPDSSEATLQTIMKREYELFDQPRLDARVTTCADDSSLYRPLSDGVTALLHQYRALLGDDVERAIASRSGVRPSSVPSKGHSDSAGFGPAKDGSASNAGCGLQENRATDAELLLEVRRLKAQTAKLASMPLSGNQSVTMAVNAGRSPTSLTGRVYNDRDSPVGGHGEADANNQSDDIEDETEDNNDGFIRRNDTDARNFQFNDHDDGPDLGHYRGLIEERIEEEQI